MSNAAVKAAVIGCSSGGVEGLNSLFSHFTEPLKIPLIIVLHVAPQGEIITEAFGSRKLSIKEAEDKEPVAPGTIYFAAPGYHLLLEDNHSFSLSNEEPVQYSRPSIDVLFESAAAVYGDGLLGILLTGANEDGAKGLQRIHKRGGITIVQEPNEAICRTMPESALKLFKPTKILTIENIAKELTGAQ